jgi:hypothetical protein
MLVLFLDLARLSPDYSKTPGFVLICEQSQGHETPYDS